MKSIWEETVEDYLEDVDLKSPIETVTWADENGLLLWNAYNEMKARLEKYEKIQDIQ